MRRLSPHVEANVTPWPNREGWLKAEVAVDGHLSWPFDIDATIWSALDDKQRTAYLQKNALTLIGRYGDAREVRIREDGQIIARNGEAEL